MPPFSPINHSSALYTAAQVRELDRQAIEVQGIPGIHLMKRAGQAVWHILLECWPDLKQLTVYCGAGNNGGDGYIVAALAARQNIPVQVICLGDVAKLRGDALRACQFAREQQISIRSMSEAVPPVSGVVVDALLGTGLKGEVREPFCEAIEQINTCDLPVVAVDIPSGLNSDTGAVSSVCVQADLTVSFIGLKRGLFTGMGPQVSGEVFFDDLQVPSTIYTAVEAEANRLEPDSLLSFVAPRKRVAHKGHFGHVAVLGGDHGWGGAVLMAAEAAARCGSGLTTVATREEHVAALLARRPELMARGLKDYHQLPAILRRASVLVLGPGLGHSAWSEQIYYHGIRLACQHKLPVVLDADGLNLLASGLGQEYLPEQLVLTPHPGEAARLLDSTVEQVQTDRFAAIKALRQKYRATVLLKGAGSLVLGEQSLAVCTEGNPGMASGGMGDVLSGVIAALIAQHLDVEQAVQLGAGIHARAADRLAERFGERGLLATDLIAEIRQLLNFHD
jgi:NAD(P)H-hydrate epimerase